ncbi:MAG: hypothetical protein JF588_22300 [Caulobacterales bacterium]|nr:hypothetical protein [Caulobacterales bacterium]
MSEFAFLFRGRELLGSAEQQQKTLEKWGVWMADLSRRGLITDPGLPLQDEAKRVAGPARVIHDGPFAEIKDLVNGFIVVTADDIDAACEIAKGCPIFEHGGGVEVRPVASMTP